MFLTLYNELLYRPLFNVLVFLYETVSFADMGIAIIALTVLIRLALYPLSRHAVESQKNMMAIQPEVKKLQEKYKDNKEEQMKRIMELYKEKKVNPFSGCVPILIQLPIIIALYQVFLAGFNDESLSALYSFIPNPGSLHHSFLGLVDLSAKKNIILALLAGALQFYQSKMMLDEQKKVQGETSANDFSANMSKQMTYTMPVVTVVVSYTLPAGLALYWAVTTLVSIIQQVQVLRKKTH